MKIVASGPWAVFVVAAITMASTSYAWAESGGRSYALNTGRRVAIAALRFQETHGHFPHNLAEASHYLPKGVSPSGAVLRISQKGNSATAHIVVTDIFRLHYDQDYVKAATGWHLTGDPRVVNL